MTDLNILLQEYHTVMEEMERLKLRKAQLREAIADRVGAGSSASLWVGETEVQPVVRTSTTVHYNEEALRRKLGDRVRLILNPDTKRIRKHFSEIRPVLEPFLDRIGSVSRDLVAEHIKSGEFSIQDFSGLCTKEGWRTGCLGSSSVASLSRASTIRLTIELSECSLNSCTLAGDQGVWDRLPGIVFRKKVSDRRDWGAWLERHGAGSQNRRPAYKGSILRIAQNVHACL